MDARSGYASFIFFILDEGQCRDALPVGILPAGSPSPKQVSLMALNRMLSGATS